MGVKDYIEKRKAQMLNEARENSSVKVDSIVLPKGESFQSFKSQNNTASAGSYGNANGAVNVQNARQAMMFQPAQDQQRRNWHIDQNSTTSEVLARIYDISRTDRQKANELYNTFSAYQQQPGSAWYSPYKQATNPAIAEIAALGIDVSGGINDKWFQDNAWLKNEYRLGSSGSPLAPAKKSSNEQDAAYWYDHILDAEQTTQAAEKEWAALQEEIKYWANRKDRNYSDDDILSKIDWSQYKTLQKMDEATGTLGDGQPTFLNRPIGYTQDNLKGVIWAARNNGSTGDPFADATQYVLGNGNKYQANEEISRKLDPASEYYSPYSVGSTLDDAALYFGVESFSPDWLAKNRGYLSNGDETAQKMYGKVYEAEQTTLKAEAELKELRDSMESYLSGNKVEVEQVLSWLQDDLDSMSTLKRMDESRDKGDGNLVATTRAVNYRWEDIEAEVRRRVEEKNQRQNSTMTLKKSNERLQNQETIQYGAAEQDSKDTAIGAANSIIQKDGTPAEKAVFKQAGSFHFVDYVRGLWHSLIGGNADPQSVTQTEQQMAADYAADHLYDSRRVIDQYENAQKNKEDAQKTIDEIMEGKPKSSLPGPGLVGTVASAGASDQPMRAPELGTDESKAFEIWMAQNRDLVMDISEEADWDDDVSEQMLWEEYQRQRNQTPEERYIESLDPETRAAYDDAQRTLQKSEATIAELQSDYEQSQRYMEEIANRQDVAAQVAAANGTELGPDVVQAMNDLYEIGAEYKPTVFSTETIFDAMLKDGRSKEETITAAKKAVEEYTAGLKRIQELLDTVPDKAKTGDVYNNVRREQERLERELTAAQNYATIGDKDFEKNAEAGLQALYDDMDAIQANKETAIIDGRTRQPLDLKSFTDPVVWALERANGGQFNLSAGDDEMKASLMTEEERQIFYSLYSKNPDEAVAWFNYLEDDTYGVLTNRMAEANEEYDESFAKSQPVLANAISIIESPFKVTGGAYGFWQLITGQDVNPNSSWLSFSRQSNTIKNTTKQEITDYFGENTLGAKIANLGYDVFTSVGESTMNTLTFGSLVPGASGVGKILTDFLGATPMAISAAGDAISEAVSNGADPNQALGMGMVTLLAEAGTEAITFGNMRTAFGKGTMDSAAGVKAFIVDTIKDMGEEAAGEMINEAVESLADDEIMGELGKRQERINYYRSEEGGNHTLQEAEDLANREIIHNVLYAGLSGALSSAVTTTTSAAAGKATASLESTRAYRNNIAILEEAAAADTASQTGAIAAVLSRDVQMDQAIATAVTLADELGDEKATNTVKHIEAVAANSGVKSEDVHNALRTAAIGQGASHEVLLDIAEHGANKEKVNSLVEAAAADSQTAETQEAIDQTTADIRVAGAMREEAANGAFDSVYASQQEAQKARNKLRTSEKELQRQQKKAEQLGDALLASQEQYFQNINPKTEGGYDQAINDVKGQNEVIQEYEQAVKNDEESLSQAEKKYNREREKALAIAREQSEINVANENAQREIEAAQAVDTAENAQYNNNEVSENAIQPGSIDQGEGTDEGQLSAEPGRDDGRGNNVYAGSVEGQNGFQPQGTTEANGQNLRRMAQSDLTEAGRNNLKNRGVTDFELDDSQDQERFSSSLAAAKQNNPYGIFVDNQSVEDLQTKGAKTYLSTDGSAGAAVGTVGIYNGDIFGVFKDPASSIKKASVSAIIQAIRDGGNKLDCYDGFLRENYGNLGFVPVARVAFNDAFVEGWNYERDGRPDVLFWMHNGDSADTVAEKFGLEEDEGGYHKYTDEEIAALPLFDDVPNESGEPQYGYDRAWEYRDQLLAEAQQTAQETAQENNTQQPITPNAYKGSNMKAGNSTNGNVVSGQNTIEAVTDALGITNDRRVKKYLRQLKKKARGYTYNNGIIHVKNAQDTNAAVHEIGHNLDVRMGMKSWVNDMDALAQEYATQVDPNFLMMYDPSKYGDELMAEFSRVWANNRNTAVSVYGADFVNRYEQELKKNGWLQAMQTAAEQMRRWDNASSMERAESMVTLDVKKNREKISINKLRTNLADHTLPLQQITDAFVKSKGSVEASKDARTLKLAEPSIVANLTEANLYGQLTDTRGNAVKKKDGTEYGSLADITNKVGKDREKAFNTYLLAKLQLERGPRGKSLLPEQQIERDPQGNILRINGINAQEVVAQYEAANADFQGIANELYDWFQAFQEQWWVGYGLSQKEFETLRALYPSYVPLMAADSKPSGASKRTDANQAIKAKKAYETDVNKYNPIMAMVETVQKHIAAAKNIEAMRAFDEQMKQLYADGLELAGIAEPAQKDMKAENWKHANEEARKEIADLVDSLKQNGDVTDDAADRIFDLMDNLPEMGFVAKDATGNDVLNIPMEDGSISAWTVYDPQVLKALTMTKPGGRRYRVARAIAGLTRFLSANATSRSLKFSGQNVFSDIETIADTAKTGYGSMAKDIVMGTRPVHIAKEVWAGLDLLRNMAAETAAGQKLGLKTSEKYEDFKKFGLMGNRYAFREGRSQRETRNALYGGHKSFGEALLAVVKSPVTFVEAVSNFGEEMSRYNTFGYSGFDLSTYDGKLAAGRASREGSVDFSKFGAAADSNAYKIATTGIAFLNAQIQGIDKTLDTLSEIKNDPYRRGVLVGRLAVNSLMLGALTAGLRQVIWGDDEEEGYKDLTDYEKTKFIHLFRWPNGSWFKIKRSQDMFIQTADLLGEMAGETLSGYDGDALSDLANGMREIVKNGFISTDTVFQPMIDAVNGTTWYGSDIDTYTEKTMSKTARYGVETSRAARLVSTLTGGLVSPNAAEYAVKQYLGSTGTLGTTIFDTLATAVKDKRVDGSFLYNWVKDDIASGFVVDPVYSNKLASAYYTGKENLDYIVSEGKNGKAPELLRSNLTKDQMSAAYAEAVALTSKGGAVYDLGKTYSDLKKQYNAVIDPESTMTPVQQEEEARRLKHQMNMAMLEANTAMGDYFNKYGYSNGIEQAVYNSLNILTGDDMKATPYLPTSYDAMPETFKNDSDEKYMQYSNAVYEKTGKASALPHPNTSFDYKHTTYQIESEYWDRWVEEYKHGYSKSVNDNAKNWDRLSSEEQLDILGTAHRKGNEAAKKWYKSKVLGLGE